MCYKYGTVGRAKRRSSHHYIGNRRLLSNDSVFRDGDDLYHLVHPHCDRAESVVIALAEQGGLEQDIMIEWSSLSKDPEICHYARSLDALRDGLVQVAHVYSARLQLLCCMLDRYGHEGRRFVRTGPLAMMELTHSKQGPVSVMSSTHYLLSQMETMQQRTAREFDTPFSPASSYTFCCRNGVLRDDVRNYFNRHNVLPLFDASLVFEQLRRWKDAA